MEFSAAEVLISVFMSTLIYVMLREVFRSRDNNKFRG